MVFGITNEEKAQLRDAADRLYGREEDERASTTTGSTSAYETAEEGQSGDFRDSVYSYSALENELRTEHPIVAPNVTGTPVVSHAHVHDDEEEGDQSTIKASDDDGTHTPIVPSSDSINHPEPQITNDKNVASNHGDVLDTASASVITEESGHNPTAYAPASDSDSEVNRGSLRRISTTDEALEHLEELDENELNKVYSIQRIKTGGEDPIEGGDPLDIVRTLTRKHPGDEEGIEVKDLDWDLPDDPLNPHNWPKYKKWYVTLTLALACLTASLGSSLFVSGTFEMMQRFGASQTLMISGLTFYMLGLALGPVIASPLSEMIGRKWIYVFSFCCAILMAMGVGLAKNTVTLLVLRFFVGYFISPCLAIAGGSMSDMWNNSPPDMSLAVALFCLTPFLGPVIGPIIGGFAAVNKGWEWSAAWIFMIFTGFNIPLLIIAPETYKVALLKKRHMKRGTKIISHLDKDVLRKMIAFSLIRPLEMLVVEPIVAFLSLYIAFVFAVLFGFFEAFPIIFVGVYHIEQELLGLTFISIGLGLIIAIIMYTIYDWFVVYPKNPDGTRGKRDEEGNFVWDKPESKLIYAKVGGLLIVPSLFWLGWAAKKDVHWIVPVLAGLPFGFGLIWIFFGCVLYFSMSFPPVYVALALAANNMLRYIMASVFPLFTVQMYEKLHIGWASTLFGFIALLLVPIPFIFSKWGPQLRATSKYGFASYFKKIAAEKAAAAAAAASKQEQKPATGAERSQDASVNSDGTVNLVQEKV
ncbi:uncharacterized protein KQ657_004503 [Scheffersomyces spartinae]|uniref:Major facilitator superfamily (MFS) profile domain-containing protein n=1 Tax=Scheffersomyces spartinae TaxID=45513 RepID=A0A9P8AK63_9ASCO|nr:uncharacterized protein KQ657_004503 [Scheffersomyces spartinae]KAG7194822.1 hypothetical protein KQ657_004503 [Scheffersomyces spartinae]